MTYPTVWIIDKVLEICRSMLGPKVINRTDGFAVLIGGWGLYAVTILLFLGMLILGARAGDFELILYAFAVLPIGALLHWVAIKLLDTNERLIASTPTAIRSENFLNVVAVLLILIGVIGIPVMLVIGLIDAVNGVYSSLERVGMAALALYVGILALNPARVNVRHSKDATIGQEAIGVLTFFLKALYKAVPLFFGIFVVVAGIMAFVLLIQSIADPANAGRGFANAIYWYAAAALAPVLGYIFFLIGYIAIDVVRSILTLGAQDDDEFASMDAAAGGSGARDWAPPPEAKPVFKAKKKEKAKSEPKPKPDPAPKAEEKPKADPAAPAPKADDKPKADPSAPPPKAEATASDAKSDPPKQEADKKEADKKEAGKKEADKPEDAKSEAKTEAAKPATPSGDEPTKVDR